MKNILLIINGPAYGADETFNAMRLAVALSRRDDATAKGFLRHGGQIACCGTCLDARGLTQDQLIEGAPRSTIEELAAWTVEADEVLTF